MDWFDWSWWYLLLLIPAVVLFLWGRRYWTNRRYARTLPLGAVAMATGAVLGTVVLLLVFGEGLRYLLDIDAMDWWIFTGWARSSFVRWTLVVLLLVIVGLSVYIWRVDDHRKRLHHGPTAVAVTTP
ncbi:hypothetical protein EYC59_04545 [Candidatus Saccharibacteria bacterium]|nr:MAG: hypothetical protein EYC59_04545 [Candidatus Saccharibacteria bacterium]